MLKLALRMLLALGGVAIVTYVAHRVVAVNATTVGFAYLLLVLAIASTWGFLEAALASIAGTLAFNFFFFPPFGTLTIADPQNWVALCSFLTTALIASRLSDKAKRQAREAIGRRQDVERLYTLSRAILLVDDVEPFARQLSRKLAEIFGLSAVVLYDRRSGEFFRGGPSDFEGLDDRLRDAALQGTTFSDATEDRVIIAVRLGAEPIASLALEGSRMPDSVLQSIANLVAIGLERARAQDLAGQVEAARQSEQLRTTLIDAMAHEFKTPLTSIKAATSSLLASPGQSQESRTELLQVADEEAGHLQQLIDDAIEMARLDTARIEVHPEPANAGELVGDVVAAMQPAIADRPIELIREPGLPDVDADARLLRLAVKQILDNALKYSPPASPVVVRVRADGDAVAIEITDHGIGIPPAEQERIFDRFYRSGSARRLIPGTGLGLSIAHGIMRAHNGSLTVESLPGETTFRLTVPARPAGARA